MCRREVNLTEEEKETLKAEGLPIPTTLPLTKVNIFQQLYDPISLKAKDTFRLNPTIGWVHNLLFFGLRPWAIIHGVAKLANTFITQI